MDEIRFFSALIQCELFTRIVLVFIQLSQFYCINQNMDKQGVPPGYVCIIGNDGTGKSTTCTLINSSSKYAGVQRSMKIGEDQIVKKLVKEIKQIDKLTYSYAFEDDWYNFDISHTVNVNGTDVKVYWILLVAPTPILSKRISTRPDMTIYEHEKCIEYFNYVYEEMAYFYGMHLVKSDQPKEKVVADIINIVETSNGYLPIKNLTLDTIVRNDLENNIISLITDHQADAIYDQKILLELQKSGMHNFYFPALYDFDNIQTKKALAARYIINSAARELDDKKITFRFKGAQQEEQQKIQVQIKQGYLLQKIVEGESKILYKILTNNKEFHNLFDQKVIILLKGTIYSHTNQRTAQISELGKIRAKGSMIFLEMLKRNHISHSYVCVNKQGIILSRKVEVNNMEIVFKKECLGTDKHSYFGIRGERDICEENGCYQGGVYIRFDWRNPNHFLLAAPTIILNSDPYYYIIEKIAGKQAFFKKFLISDKCKPMGDKCISQDVLSYGIDTKNIKFKAIQAYCTFQYYAHQVGLQILDGCMMIDKQSKYIWSQINPDCLRVKSTVQRQDYDKDIWRAGGSSSKDLIKKKWSLFNEIFIQYFKKNKFMNSQVVRQPLCKQLYAQQLLKKGNLRAEYRQFYRRIVRGYRIRQVIGTIDIINGQPILVQSSIFKQKHSSGKIEEAINYLSLLPQVLVVDIDGASGKQHNNKALIESLASKPNISLYAVGGGIRTIQTAKSYLTQFQHIVISSNLDIIQQIPQEQRRKIIVQLSVNEHDQILTHARTLNTGVKVVKKMVELCELGIEKISITFNNSEGKLQGLPREQIRKIMNQIPGPIKKIIIAGGVSSIDDIEFLWGFPKCVPQLGSALWKKKISIGQIYSKIVRFDEYDLVPAVIQNKYGKNLGLFYLNEQALLKTCDQKILYRYSRQHGKVMMKGEQSGNTQKVLSMNIDCDNDTLLITVDDEHPIFCHTKTQSCFYQKVNKSEHMNLEQLQDHILRTKSGGGSGYTHKIQNNPKLAISKVKQEVQELQLAECKERKVQQCADVLAHLLMFMNSEDIKLEEVTALLNKRSKIEKRPKVNAAQGEDSKQQKVVRIGLGTGKHTNLIFQFLQKSMGVKMLPHAKGRQRDYTILYEIVDKQKFESLLNITGDEKIVFMTTKPKDLTKMMQKNYIQFGVNYSNVIENSCDTFNIIAEKPVEGLRLALIKRKGQDIHPQKWSQENKGLIVSQYPVDAVNYFKSKNIPSNHYTLTKVCGHSQGFLSDPHFSYCDAIVLSGKTIEDNQLEIEAILKPEIKVLLFSLDQS